MLSIDDLTGRLCDGLSRRTLLRAGTLAALGSGLGVPAGWPGVWRSATAAPNETASSRREQRAKSVIVLFLLGGPPQHSTWDPKPTASAEVRGVYDPIATNVPGLQICELLPEMSRRMNHLAVLRAVTTGDNAHSSSGYFMMTGVPHIPQNRENANPGAPNDWPTMGGVIREIGQRRSLIPSAVRLPHHIYNTDGSVWPGQDSGWLGHAAEPWLFNCEPASTSFDVPQFRLAADVTLDRLTQRRSLLQQMNSQLREVDRSPQLEKFSGEQRQAFELLTTPEARSACDLSLEVDSTRDRYGRSQFGQSVLLARRLVEADVEFVQVNWFRGKDEPSDNPCWDSHTNESARLKEVLVPPLDQAFSALLDDLEQSGRLDETLVVCMAEFGRTPKFNGRAGRDHWGHVFSIALAGGGVKGGQVIGASDDQGAWPVQGVVQPQDVTATIFHALGYPPDTMMLDSAGRPHPISRGNVITDLF